MIRSAKVILAVIAMILPTSFLEVNAHCNCYDVLTDSTVDLSEIKYKSKAELAGGIILILLGFKILLEHLHIL